MAKLLILTSVFLVFSLGNANASTCKATIYHTTELIDEVHFQPGQLGPFPWHQDLAYSLIKTVKWESKNYNLLVDKRYVLTGRFSYVLFVLDRSCRASIRFTDFRDHQVVGRFHHRQKNWFLIAAVSNQNKYNVVVNSVHGINYTPYYY